MTGREGHLYSHHVPPVVQPPPPPSYHPVAFQQQDPTLYPHNLTTPLHPFSQNHMHLPPVSAGTEYQDVMHERIKVEQPIKKTRRRRGEAAAERNAALATSASLSRPARINPHPGVVIKTKFPVARIKRIMQADEDVGKVAQVTPVIVSKALELFMIGLCAKATEQARARNSKRITARDLKQVVIADEQFDFLEEIMAKVPDFPAPSDNNQGSMSDEEANASGGPSSAKKPRKPRTRKPKEEDAY